MTGDLGLFEVLVGLSSDKCGLEIVLYLSRKVVGFREVTEVCVNDDLLGSWKFWE
jgi:hypothetical protein